MTPWDPVSKLCNILLYALIALIVLLIVTNNVRFELQMDVSPLHSCNTGIAQHVNALLQLFTNSEVRPKWLQWRKLAPPCFPSAWTFAKHCAARVRPSTSPSPSARTSPSPWTPGVRKSVLQRGEEEGKPFHQEKKCNEETGVPE